MPSSSPLIIGIGEILWDMLPSGRQLGGAPANFVYHAAALGARGITVSRVGDDALGRDILWRLNDLNLDCSHVSVDPSHPSGTVDVRLDPAGVPEYVIHTGVAWDFLPHDQRLLHLAHDADAICFGTLGQRSRVSRESIGKFIAAARPSCLRVLDINLRQTYFSRELILELLMMTDVLKLNDQEMPIVARMLDVPDATAAEKILRDFPVRLIALTRGPAGSTLFSRDGEVDSQPAAPGPVIDTVGAGDAFTAALVMGLLDGQQLSRINLFANRLAAFVCGASGATPALPASLVQRR